MSCSRVNSISHLKITNMYLTDTEWTFVFDDVLKHSRPSFKEKPLVFRACPQNPKLCPFHINIHINTVFRYKTVMII